MWRLIGWSVARSLLQVLALASALVACKAANKGGGEEAPKRTAKSAPAASAREPAPADDGAMSDAKARAAVQYLMAGADCSPTSHYALRPFCPTEELSSALPLPTKPTSLPGITVAVSKDKTPKQIALDTTHLSVLHLDGNSARLTRVTPDNDDEKRQLFETIQSVASMLRGDAKSVSMSSGLRQFFASELTKPRHELSIKRSGATFEGNTPARLYASDRGPSYVVFEDGGKLTYVSVFPAKGS